MIARTDSNVNRPDVYARKAIATRKRRRESDARWIEAYQQRRQEAQERIAAIAAQSKDESR